MRVLELSSSYSNLELLPRLSEEQETPGKIQIVENISYFDYLSWAGVLKSGTG
jgi:hypothetical protein